uniref:Uncharacterized protein n=1 Tax=Oryza barthii TaxID=65489 RepID=A0A0D3ENF5_9ORYZ
MSMSGPREACDVTGLDEFYKRMQARVWRTRSLLVFAAAVVTILVGSGVYSRRHRRDGFARFIFLGASTLYLPVVSYLVSDISGENCGLPKDVKECKDMSAFFLEAWAILVLIFGANSFVIAAADDHGGQNVHRPIVELLLYAFLKAQRSFAHGRNPRLIAGYMDQLKQDIMSSSSSSHHAQAVNVALPLLVMGEDEQQVEEGPHGYRFRGRKGNESLVTIGKVQIMSSTDGVLSSWPPLKDLCLSFSLFKLLRRRFASILLIHCNTHDSTCGFGSTGWANVIRSILPSDNLCVDVRCWNDKPLEYEYMLLLLVEKSKSNMILNKGLTLGKQLVEGIEDEEMGWRVLAGFWSEMILYIAPSNNIDAHRRAIARGGELITIMWALLTHAGILTRASPSSRV